MSGFTKRAESEYDPFGAAHASTSISAALGMAVSADLKKEDRRAIAVIGDGAMTAGMAFEALSHAGSIDENFTVVLNDNQMSISNNVGGLKNYLAKISASRLYNQIREGGKTVLRFIPRAAKWVRKAEIHAKGMIAPGTLFEELGFNYIGPMDGHNLKEMLRTLETLKSVKGPKFLHLITQKGKGYKPAEDSGDKYHGVSKFNISTGQQSKSKSNVPSYTKVFSETLIKHAEKDTKIIGITGAMPSGTGLNLFEKRFPDRMLSLIHI